MLFHFYGLIVGIAIVVSWEIAKKRIEKKNIISLKEVENIFLWIILGGIIGARLYHVIDKWGSYYSFDPVKVLFIWNGGLGIWGAIIGGGVALLINSRTKKKRIPLAEILDSVAYGLPTGQAIGRLGNWANKELVGKNGQPLFVFEMILNLILFGVLTAIDKKKNKSGVIVACYLIGYGLIRFFLETLRREEDIWRVANIPMAWLMATTAIFGGSIFLVWRQKQP